MKTSLRPVLLCALLSSLGAGLAQARPLVFERSWNELNATIQDQWIDIRLPDQTRLRGQALRVTPESLVMDVRRSSNHLLHPQGRVEIPRAQVTELEMRLWQRSRPGGGTGARIGAAVGSVVGTGAGLGLGETGHEGAAVAVWIGTAIAGAVIGHYLFDRGQDDPNRPRVVVIDPPAERQAARRDSTPVVSSIAKP